MGPGTVGTEAVGWWDLPHPVLLGILGSTGLVLGTLAWSVRGGVRLGLLDEAGSEQEPEGEAPGLIDLEAAAAWLIRARWLVASGILVLGPGIGGVSGIVAPTAMLPLGLVSLGLFAANLVYASMLRRTGASSDLLRLQLFGDLLFHKGLVHFAGGIEHPLGHLAVFHVVLAGILLGRGDCYRIATTAWVLYAGLAIGELTGVLAHYSLGIGHDSEFERAFMADEVAVDVSFAAIFLAAAAGLTSFLMTRIRAAHSRVTRSALATELAHRRLVEIVEAAGVGILVLDSGLHPILRNSRIAALMSGSMDGGDPAEGAVEVWISRTPELARALATGEQQVVEWAPRGGEGPVLRARIVRLGGTAGVAVLVRDITRDKEAEARQVRLGKLAAVGEIAARVAHDVSNPALVISAKAHRIRRLLDGSAPGGVAEDLDKIARQAERLGTLTQGLLGAARVAHADGSQALLADTVAGVLAFFSDRILAQRVTVENGSSGAAVAVGLPPHELEAVLINLIGNSLDAMPEGGRLELRTSSLPAGSGDAPNRILLTLADSGPGVPPDLRDRLFEPYFTTKAGGTGLGLASARELLQARGGRIELECPAGGGTVIRLDLPIASGAPPRPDPGVRREDSSGDGPRKEDGSRHAAA